MRVENRSRQARSDMVPGTVIVAHRYDAAVTTAHAAAHETFDRDLAGAVVAPRDFRGGCQHPFRAARVDHDLAARRTDRQLTVEWRSDAARFAGAAVLCR